MPDNFGSMFLRDQLKQRIPELYERRFPSLWAIDGTIIPSIPDLEVAARTVAYEVIEYTGEAAVSAGSDDVPFADASVGEKESKALAFKSGAFWSREAVEAARFSGRDIVSVKLEAIARAVYQSLHKFAVFGIARYKTAGLFNLPDVQVVDSSFDADDPAVDAQDIVKFFGDSIRTAEANKVYRPDTILAPDKLVGIARELLMPNSAKTALSHILEAHSPANSGALRRIIPISECESEYLLKYGVHATGVAKDRLVFLPTDAAIVHRKFYELEYTEIDENRRGYAIDGRAGSSEVICPVPEALTYVDIPKL